MLLKNIIIQTLPLDDSVFIAMARSANLFPLDSGDHINAEPTRAGKVDYFLHVIEPGADIYLPIFSK